MLSKIYSIVRPALFLLPPENVCNLAMSLVKSGLIPVPGKHHVPELELTLWDRKFPNPVGLASGFDKNAETIAPLLSLGFGYVEAGTVTPKAQEGNPKPRIFPHSRSGSVINRMGFPNLGMNAFKINLENALSQKPRPVGLIGINMGMNKNQKEPAKDYCLLVRTLGPLADYLVLNISSPNTPGLIGLQKKDKLLPLLEGVLIERNKSCGSHPPPLLVKLSPDLNERQMKEIAFCVLESGIDGMIISNTSMSRPQNLPEDYAARAGGLSGKPIRESSTETIRNMYALTDGRLPIIGAGGIFTGEDAYEKIRAGASLVQIYTSMLYRGPYIADMICEELLQCLKKDGFSNVMEAVGADHR
jgi:dihydroorotate dehydrogenase